MTAAEEAPRGSTESQAERADAAKVVRIDRADAASIALKVAINDRVGKASPQWMREVAEHMGIRPAVS